MVGVCAWADGVTGARAASAKAARTEAASDFCRNAGFTVMLPWIVDLGPETSAAGQEPNQLKKAIGCGKTMRFRGRQPVEYQGMSARPTDGPGLRRPRRFARAAGHKISLNRCRKCRFQGL